MGLLQEAKDKVDALEQVSDASCDHAKWFLDDSKAPPTRVAAHAGLAALIYDKPGSRFAFTFRENGQIVTSANYPELKPLGRLEGRAEKIEAARRFGVEE